MRAAGASLTPSLIPPGLAPSCSRCCCDEAALAEARVSAHSKDCQQQLRAREAPVGPVGRAGPHDELVSTARPPGSSRSV
jgi:hypothetical protein